MQYDVYSQEPQLKVEPMTGRCSGFEDSSRAPVGLEKVFHGFSITQFTSLCIVGLKCSLAFQIIHHNVLQVMAGFEQLIPVPGSGHIVPLLNIDLNM